MLKGLERTWSTAVNIWLSTGNVHVKCRTLPSASVECGIWVFVCTRLCLQLISRKLVDLVSPCTTGILLWCLCSLFHWGKKPRARNTQGDPGPWLLGGFYFGFCGRSGYSTQADQLSRAQPLLFHGGAGEAGGKQDLCSAGVFKQLPEVLWVGDKCQ